MSFGLQFIWTPSFLKITLLNFNIIFLTIHGNKIGEYCICTNKFTGIYDKLINSRNKCIDKCENDNIYKYEYNNICYKKCSDDINKNIEEKIWYNISIFKFINITNMEIFGKNEDIYKDIVNNVLINNNISKGEELIIPGNDNFYFHITNSKNDIELLNEKNNNKTNKFSIIDLGICEDLLKEH